MRGPRRPTTPPTTVGGRGGREPAGAPGARILWIALLAVTASANAGDLDLGLALDGAPGRLPVLRADLRVAELAGARDLLLTGVSRASADERPDRLAGSISWPWLRVDVGTLRHAVLSGGRGGGTTELRDGGRWRSGDAVRVSRSVTAPVGVHATLAVGRIALRGGRWRETPDADPVTVLAAGSRTGIEGVRWEAVGARHAGTGRLELSLGRVTRRGGVMLGASAELPSDAGTEGPAEDTAPEVTARGGRALRLLVRQQGPSRTTVRIVWERVLVPFTDRPAGFARPVEGWGMRLTRDRVALDHRARLGVRAWSRTTGLDLRGPRGSISWRVRLAHRRSTDALGRDAEDEASLSGRVAHRYGAWRGELRLVTRASPSDGELGLLTGGTVTWRARRHLTLTVAVLEAQATTFPSAVSLGAAGLVPVWLDPGERALTLRIRWRGVSLHAVEILRGETPGWRLALGIRHRSRRRRPAAGRPVRPARLPLPIDPLAPGARDDQPKEIR